MPVSSAAIRRSCRAACGSAWRSRARSRREPRILLMDEPFAALDEQTRLLLGDKVLQIQQALQQTTLLITHNLTEAVQLSDRVLVMTYRPGRLKRIVDIDLPHPRDLRGRRQRRVRPLRRRDLARPARGSEPRHRGTRIARRAARCKRDARGAARSRGLRARRRHRSSSLVGSRRGADPRRRHQPLRRAAAVADLRRDPAHRRRGERAAPLLADDAGSVCRRACCSPSSASRSACCCIASASCALAYETWVAALAAAPIVLMYPLFLVIFGRSATTIVMIGFAAGLAPGDPEDARRPRGHARSAARRRPQLQAHAVAAVPQDPAARGAASVFVGMRLGLIFAMINIVGVEFLINFGGLGQLINELAERYDLPGTYAAILFVVLVSVVFFDAHGARRAMAAAGRADAPLDVRAPRALRCASAIIVARAARAWAGAARCPACCFATSCRRSVAIGRALVALLRQRATSTRNLAVTLAEIGAALVIGGVAGVAAGIVLGANRFLSRAYEPLVYYLGPTPKIIFFPVMIMWFGVGCGSKIAMGALSCFFPIAISAAAGMRADRSACSIRVGQQLSRVAVADGHARSTCPRCASRSSTACGSGSASPSSARCSPRPSCRTGARLPGHPVVRDVRHAEDVCAADRAVRAVDRRQRAARPARRPRRDTRAPPTRLS